jgi:hypothetical protein
MSPGKPNAHLSFKRGTAAAVNPAVAVSWYREFAVVALQPFQAGPESTLSAPEAGPEHMACSDGRVTSAR